LRRCIAELSLTGLTSNPTIFDHAIKNGDADAELARFAAEKVDVDALAEQLRDEGAKSFVKSWNDLLGVINSKSAIRKRAS
jgi:transaldolase